MLASYDKITQEIAVHATTLVKCSESSFTSFIYVLNLFFLHNHPNS